MRYARVLSHMGVCDPQPVPGSPADWLRSASSDLALAKLGSASDEVLPAQVCYPAQQTVEKVLKGLLVGARRSYPPVHDVEQLLERLRETDVDLPGWADDLLELTPYATEARYPAYWEPITQEDERRALELARKTLDWFREDLRSA